MFQNSKNRIKNEIFPFYSGKDIDNLKIKEFISTLNLIQNNKIDIIVLTAPLAPTVYNTLINDAHQRFSYLISFNSFAKNNHIYNFLNPQSLTTTNCEFYDGFHGGDVVYAKMLYQISKQNSTLAHSLNLAKIQQVISLKSGHANSTEFAGWREIDFLDIGCKK